MRRIKAIYFCCLLPLAGCAASGAVASRPVTIEVPIAVPCRPAPVAAPTWPMDALPQQADIFETVQTLLAECELRRAYEIKLLSSLDLCR